MTLILLVAFLAFLVQIAMSFPIRARFAQSVRQNSAGTPVLHGRLTTLYCSTEEDANDIKTANTSDTVNEPEVSSKEMARLQRRIDETNKAIEEIRELQKIEGGELKELEKEFGAEIARVKKEFSRMKERSIEEAVEASNKVWHIPN